MNKITKEYIKQLCEMLLKDNLTQNGKRKIVNYIEDLQQRNDKAIEYIKDVCCEYHDDDLEPYGDRIDTYKLLAILQGEEVKDNEL